MILCRTTGETMPWDDRSLRGFLEGRGVPIGVGGIATGVDDAGPFVRCHLPTGYSPVADLDAYAPPSNPERTARGYLRQRWVEIRGKTPAQRAAATLNENDLYALLVMMRADQ